jgi:hypothetical protein
MEKKLTNEIIQQLGISVELVDKVFCDCSAFADGCDRVELRL